MPSPSRPEFMALTYLHLAGALGVTAVAAEYPLVKSSGIEHLIVFILTIVLIFPLVMLPPGPLKYGLFAVFAILFGQTLAPLVEHLQDKGLIRQVLLMVAGIFVGMTALAFLDRGATFLGFGPYLFAGLVGLILSQLIGIAAGVTGAITAASFYEINQIFAWIGAIIFTIYVAYDTQVMRARAAKAGPNPDYVAASMGLYLDIINLFADVGRLNS